MAMSRTPSGAKALRMAEAYILGIFSRYYPSLWMHLIRGHRVDAVYPLHRATIQHIKDDFSELVRSELRRI
jgi:hypothetical protein